MEWRFFRALSHKFFDDRSMARQRHTVYALRRLEEDINVQDAPAFVCNDPQIQSFLCLQLYSRPIWRPSSQGSITLEFDLGHPFML